MEMEVSDHQSRPQTVHLGQLSLGTERERKLCCLFGQRLCTPLPASLLLLLVLLILLIVVLLLSSPSLSFFFFFFFFFSFSSSSSSSSLSFFFFFVVVLLRLFLLSSCEVTLCGWQDVKIPKTLHLVNLKSSGAVWKSRWPSWAFRPNEPYGFCGRKATLNHA